MPGKRPTIPMKPQRLSSYSGDEDLPIHTQARSSQTRATKKGLYTANRGFQNSAGQNMGDMNEAEEEGADEQSDVAEGNNAEDVVNDDEKSSEAGSEQQSSSSEGGSQDAAKKKKKPIHPQDSIKKFWKNYDPDYEGKLMQVLPDPIPQTATSKPKRQVSQNSRQSYEEAKAACIRDVERIIQECLMANQKYTDPHFDIERDLKITMQRNCFTSLNRDVDDDDDIPSPADVKRVTDIFEDPVFYADGAGADDIMQGSLGDCWLLAALATLAVNEELLKKVSVIQHTEIGVYGFVFYRDGEWQQTIIDDKLYLRAPSFDEDSEELLQRWGISQDNQEAKYEELFQRGSKALLFAHCRDQNEVWVPLLEKAMAKAHGGYDALSGGYSGEAVEDLTGGVTSEIYTSNILSKNRFWAEMRSNGIDFLFGCSMARYKNWRAGDYNESSMLTWAERRKGIIDHHAYSVLDTYEGHGKRLVKVRNPWGEGDRSEWRGKWSDGSKEWTPEWLKILDHHFGNDGIFWISFDDFLKNYKFIERTRLFDDSWFTAQKWTSIQVPFNTLDYQQTKFTIDVSADTEAVLVLSQLDSRYFRGLEGKYGYALNFRVSREDDESNYVARSRALYNMDRSNNVELLLKEGRYVVLIKVEAFDWGRPSPEEVIRKNMPGRKEKVVTLGRLYDLAHMKGRSDAETAASITGKEEAEIASGTLDTEDKGTATEDDVPGDATVGAVASTKDNKDDKPTAEASATVEKDEENNEDESEDEDDAKDPWNANCVVGLRVYSRLPDLAVEVIRPPEPENKQPTVDVDAVTKAAQSGAEKKLASSEATPSEENDDE